MKYLSPAPSGAVNQLGVDLISHAKVDCYLGLNLCLCASAQNITPTHLIFCPFPRTRIRCDLTLECGQGAIARSALSLEFGKPTLFVLDFDDVATSTRMPKWLRLGKRGWQIRLRCLWILLSNQCSFLNVQFDKAQRKVEPKKELNLLFGQVVNFSKKYIILFKSIIK